MMSIIVYAGLTSEQKRSVGWRENIKQI